MNCMNDESLNLPLELPWLVYILVCSDGTLYTGMTNDLEKRLKKHNQGIASRYTRSRLPVKVVYSERHQTRSEVLRREKAIKSLSRQEKQQLIRTSSKS